MVEGTVPVFVLSFVLVFVQDTIKLPSRQTILLLSTTMSIYQLFTAALFTLLSLLAIGLLCILTFITLTLLELPPAKRRRGLAGSVISSAFNAALIGAAVGLTVFRMYVCDIIFCFQANSQS